MSKRVKYTIEYLINSSPELLYNYLSSPIGLTAWFAENVNLNGDIFTFMWEGSEEKAKLTTKRPNKHIRFDWVERKGEFVSFDIDKDELTGDVALVITDFEDEEDVEEARMIYDQSIERLHGTIG